MFVVGLAPRRKRKQTSGIMLDRLTKSRGGRMEIRFEAGLKRPRDATESAKLVSEAAVAVRCHVRILPTWIQYRNDTMNIGSVSVHQTVRLHIKKHATVT